MRAALLSLVTIVVIATGCVSNGDHGLVVLEATAAGSGTDICMATGMTGQPAISGGVISTFSTSGYMVTPLLQSKITASPSMQIQRTIFLTGASVELSVPSGGGSATVPPKFEALFAGNVPPDGTANVSFELVPASVIQSVTTGPVEVLAKVTVFGTLGGDTISSDPWQFPVTICSNCVVVEHGTCPMLISAVHSGNPCNIYQDGTVDCCRDATTGGLICPGVIGVR